MSIGRNLETVSFGCVEIETFVPTDKRATFEKIRCRTEGGYAEFRNEVRRVEKIRAGYTEWDPVVVQLVLGDHIYEKAEIA